MAAQRQGVALLDSQAAARQVEPFEKLGQHLQGFGRGYDLQGGVVLQQIGDGPGMVGLHVVNHQIVGSAALQAGLQLLQPLILFAGIDRVHDGHFVVNDEIGIVGDPFGNLVLALKEIQVVIVYSDIVDVGTYLGHNLG